MHSVSKWLRDGKTAVENLTSISINLPNQLNCCSLAFAIYFHKINLDPIFARIVLSSARLLISQRCVPCNCPHRFIRRNPADKRIFRITIMTSELLHKNEKPIIFFKIQFNSSLGIELYFCFLHLWHRKMRDLFLLLLIRLLLFVVVFIELFFALKTIKLNCFKYKNLILF